MLTHVSTVNSCLDPLFYVIALERYFEITNSTNFCFVKLFFFRQGLRLHYRLSFLPLMDVIVAVLWFCSSLVPLVNIHAYDFRGQS